MSRVLCHASDIYRFFATEAQVQFQAILVENAVQKVVLVLFFFEYFSLLMSIIPPVFHACSVVYIISAIDISAK